MRIAVSSAETQSVLRRLFVVWADFESALDNVPILAKLRRGAFRLDDYRALLLNHRQQVIEGSRWIARAASSITSEYADVRSLFYAHALTEHRDYLMIEHDYVAIGGDVADIRNFPKNVGAEALHGYMYAHATETNPFDLLGAMFVIEGVGNRKAAAWGHQIAEQLSLAPEQVRFLLYHGDHDATHLDTFERSLDSGILQIPGMADRIVTTSAVVARLYRLQLEELVRP